MLKGKVKTIFFDIDGTLSPDISWLKITEGLGESPEKHSEIFDAYRHGQIDYQTAKNQLISLWQDAGKANKDFMSNMFRSWPLRQGAHEIINYLRPTYQICLISGAVDLYVSIVAEKLGLEDWYANTELVWDANGNLVDFHYELNQSQKKLEQFRKYAQTNALKKEECAIVGDGGSDIDLFKELKYGIMVENQLEHELQKLAYLRIQNISDLQQIF